MTKFFSKLFNENGNVADDGSVTFDSGVSYSSEEILVMKKTKANSEDLKAIHMVKAAFGGDLEWHGKNKTPYVANSKLIKINQTSGISKTDSIITNSNNKIEAEQLSLF